jgi:hypothetical protein
VLSRGVGESPWCWSWGGARKRSEAPGLRDSFPRRAGCSFRIIASKEWAAAFLDEPPQRRRRGIDRRDRVQPRARPSSQFRFLLCWGRTFSSCGDNSRAVLDATLSPHVGYARSWSARRSSTRFDSENRPASHWRRCCRTPSCANWPFPVTFRRNRPAATLLHRYTSLAHAVRRPRSMTRSWNIYQFNGSLQMVARLCFVL